MRAVRVIGQCLTGLAFITFFGGGVVQWVWCVGLANKLWGVGGIVALCLVPPFAYLFPFVVWIVTHSFPAFYFIVWAVSLVGAGGFYWAGSTLTGLVEETWSTSERQQGPGRAELAEWRALAVRHRRRSLAVALALGLLLVVGVALGLSFAGHRRLRPTATQSENLGNQPIADVPPFDADELNKFSRVLGKAMTQPLTHSDLADIREVMEAYTRRTGRWITKEEHDWFVDSMKLSSEYMRELGQSLLISWDTKQRFTTSAYDQLARTMTDLGYRKPEHLANDKACLEAAYRNQPFVEDSQGRRYEFGRVVILQKMREDGFLQENTDKMAEVVAQYVR